MALAIDTLAYANKLQAAGFTEEQARVQVETLAEIVSENIATKADIALLQRDMKEFETALKADIALIRRDMKELETSLKRDIKEVEAALRSEIEAMGNKVTIRLGGTMVVGIAVLAAIIKLL